MLNVESEDYVEAPEPPAPIMVVEAFKDFYKSFYDKYNRQEIIDSLKRYSNAIVTDPVTSSDYDAIKDLQREGALLCSSAKLKAQASNDNLGSEAFSVMHDNFLREAGDLPIQE